MCRIITFRVRHLWLNKSAGSRPIYTYRPFIHLLKHTKKISSKRKHYTIMFIRLVLLFYRYHVPEGTWHPFVRTSIARYILVYILNMYIGQLHGVTRGVSIPLGVGCMYCSRLYCRYTKTKLRAVVLLVRSCFEAGRVYRSAAAAWPSIVKLPNVNHQLSIDNRRKGWTA